MLITMSDKEIQRLAVLQDVRDHRITQVRAAEILNLSTRQITRLLQKVIDGLKLKKAEMTVWIATDFVDTLS